MPIQQFRKPNRLPPSNYLGFGAYLVTVCTKHRQPIFISPEIVEPLVCSLSEQALKHSFNVHAYCFMPDHCHFLLAGLNPNARLSPAVRAFKGQSTVLLRRFGFHAVWQKGFHDHVIRNSDDLSSSMAYILENPVKAGLVKHPQDWPLSGSFVFNWRSFASSPSPLTSDPAL